MKRLLEEIATLVDCIQEMENQTAHGLDVLTKNFNLSCVADERIKSLKSDLKTMVEIIRRARICGEWNADGLELKCLTFNQIFRDQPK